VILVAQQQRQAGNTVADRTGGAIDGEHQVLEQDPAGDAVVTEFLTGVVFALVPGLPVATWLTRPRRYSAVVTLGVAEAVAVVLPAVLVRPPTTPAGGRTCTPGSGTAEDWSASAPGVPHTRQGVVA
jgi:hypothetical protein